VFICSERMDVAATRRAITSNTIAIIASAPCFPHGVCQPLYLYKYLFAFSN
jgi:glutamate/tyrosine decarboxylase-like PLP-dependent enzyme